MKKKTLCAVARAAAIGMVCLVTGNGFANTPHNDAHHRSSLRARVTMADGTDRRVTLQGVGCTESMCSRVRARDMKGDDLWLDGLASIQTVSHDAIGPVAAVVTFRDGRQRQASIIEWHRVLYVEGTFGLTSTLDLARVTRVDFE
jgi:hypothetical protein